MQTQIQTGRMSQVLLPITTALLLATASSSVMADKHEHEMEQHGSHEHGAARMTIATTDEGLEIVLESPAANVFGFEHKAKSEAEHKVVHEALATLKDGSVLFAINKAAACKLEDADVESAIAKSHDEEKHAEDGDHDHDDEKHADKHDDDHEKHTEDGDHDDEHDHDKHDDKHAKDGDHDDEHDHDKHDDDSHSDVEATWVYHCDKPTDIETVTVKLFSAFPKGFKDIDVEWIGASNAGKSELKEDGMINLQP